MGSAYLLLLESNDELLGPSCDVNTVRTFLSGLKSSGDIPNLSSKEVKVLLSRANTLLHSSHKLKGLLIVEALVDQVSSEVFESNALSWLQTSVSRVIDSKEATIQEKELACSVVSSVYRLSPNHPEVSKQIPSMNGGIVNSLLKNFEDSESFVTTLTQVLKVFPGSSGSSEKMRKKIFGSFEVHRSKVLCKCASFLPRLGGSGKEGANHKEAWSLYFKRFIKTYYVIQMDLINNLRGGSQEDDFCSEIEPIKELMDKPSRSKDQLASSFQGIKKLSIVKDLISEFLKSPFPYVKRFQPSLIYLLTDQVFKTVHLLNDKDNISEEYNILKCIFPSLVALNLSVLTILVKVCQKDILPFVSKNVNYISQALDLSFGDQLNFDLKVSAFELYKTMVKVLGASCGIHIHAEEIIPKLLREIIPPKFVKEENSAISSSKNGKKSKEKNVMWKKFDSKPLETVKKCEKRAKLVSESFSILSEMFLVSGCLIAPSLHKDVQIVVLRLCMDILLQRNLYNTLYFFPSVRISIYKLLITLSLNPHFKFHSPLRYTVAILSRGMSDRDPSVQEVVRSGLSAIEPCFHSRSPYLGSESYLNEAEMEKVMSEIVKVHETKIFIKRGNFGVTEKPSRETEFEDVVQNIISSTSDSQVSEEKASSNGQKESDDQEHSMEIDERSLEKPSENPAHLKKIAEMEEILKESKMKNSDEELIQTFYNQDQSPVLIPNETKEKFYEKERNSQAIVTSESESKKIKLSEDMEEAEDDGLDLNDMLSSFVHNPQLSTLKRKFKDDYVASS